MQQLIPLQKFLLSHRKEVTWLFLAYEIGMVVIWVLGLVLAKNNPMILIDFPEIGEKFGVVAFGLFVLALLPGILQRFDVFPVIRTMLMTFRRHLGVSMFLSSVVHFGFVTSIPMIVSNNFSVQLFSTREMLGFIAYVFLVPLWITSNDYSVKKMGKYWKWLHRLVYIALLFIFLHVAIVQSKFAVVAGLMIALEIMSWVRVWGRGRRIEN